MPILFHGTLTEHLPAILKNGIEPGAGWGGAGTFGTFLSGTIDGALYWAKLAYQRTHDGKMEIHRFDRDHGREADRLIAVLAVEIPESETGKLKADEEQFEDVGVDLDPDDWKQSLIVIGDVRFDGQIPAAWIREVIPPSDAKKGPAMAGAGKRQKGVHTRSNVWDDAAALKVWRGGEKLDPGVNYFVLMLDQLGLPTRFSCEGHPGGFYVSFQASYDQALGIHQAGFFTVEIEGEDYWSIRMGVEHNPAQHVDALRWAAEAWEKHLGPLEFDSVRLER